MMKILRRRLRKIPVITRKIVSSVIIVGFMLFMVIALVGYRAFYKQFRRQYDANICSIANTAREVLNPEHIKNYLSTGEKDEEWNHVDRILQDFVDKFGLNLLYVSHVAGENYTDITYIFNPVKKGGKWSEFPFLYSEHYVEPNYNSSARRVFEDGETIVRHTFKTRSGSHITAMVPVRNSDGKVIAVLGVQKSIQEFVDSGRGYIRLVLVVALVFGIMFFALFTMYFSFSFTSPLTLITRETDHFASYGGKPSDRLLAIKNQDEIGILAHSVHQMEYDVCKNIEELTKVTAEKERISTELSLAAKIQLDMLPSAYPPFPDRKDFDLFATMSPAKEVGGDLYDYLLIDDDHLMLTVGDVSGKGVPAALFMGKCKTLLDVYAMMGLSPKQIAERTNGQLCIGNDSGLFVTCWLGILTFSTGELRFINAGHTRPILYHEGEFSYIMTKPNIVLGGMEDLIYKEYTTTLSKGDRIFIYSDGITEAIDMNETLFGEDRLIEVAKTTEGLSVPDTVKKIREKLDEFVGDAEQFDDITMLAFEWKK